jgi:hypothetical protein
MQQPQPTADDPPASVAAADRRPSALRHGHWVAGAVAILVRLRRWRAAYVESPIDREP